MSDVSIGAAVATRRRHPVAAAIIGNCLEFVDFTAYGLFSIQIGRQFFPTETPSRQLLLALAAFGVGFLMRPLGGIVIGAYADRAGRKAALTLTIAIMALGTAIIGLSPSYATIGIAAPCLLVLARLLQGFSVGGEVGAATTYLLETAPAGRRGLYSSWQFASQGAALTFTSIVGLAMTQFLSAASMEAWGWRVPFLFGLLIGPVGLYLRRNMEEPPRRATLYNSSRAVLGSLFSHHAGLIVTGILAFVGGTVSVYVIGDYMTAYAQNTLSLPLTVGLTVTIISGIVLAFGSILGGWLSDRLGRRTVMILPRVLLLVAVLPAFLLITGIGSPWIFYVLIALLMLLHSVSATVFVAAVAECFPGSVRVSGLSIIQVFASAVFGGSAQFIVTWLIGVTGDPLMPAWYVAAVNLIAVAALSRLRPPPADLPLEAPTSVS